MIAHSNNYRLRPIERRATTVTIAQDDGPTLCDKVVFITGAAGGLGAALGDLLARAGAHILVGDLRYEQARGVAATLTEHGALAHAIGIDVADPASAERAVAEAIDVFGRLDVLVNNAGTDIAAPVSAIAPEQWLRVIGTNLNGPFFLSRAAASVMTAAGHGHIINVASTAAKRAWPNASAYHASKWGLLGLSHALHAELRASGIKVTAVIAGGMRTPFYRERFPDSDSNALQDPATVAQAIRSVLLMPDESVIAEITVLPMHESSWP